MPRSFLTLQAIIVFLLSGCPVTESGLIVNSLGYHEVFLNGKKAGENVLTPSVSQYDKRSLVITCYETMQKIAYIPGKTSDAELYGSKKELTRKLVHEVSIPAGSTAWIIIPETVQSYIMNGEARRNEFSFAEVGSGNYSFEWDNAISYK